MLSFRDSYVYAETTAYIGRNLKAVGTNMFMFKGSVCRP